MERRRRGLAAFALSAGVITGCEQAEAEPVPARDFCEPDAVDGQPLECCRICAVGQEVFGGCELALPPSEWPSRSATWNEWQPGCEAGATVASGRCSTGISYVWVNWPPGAGETRYFDADGTFLAFEGHTDVHSDVCGFNWYWPERVECGERTQEMGCQPASVP